MSFLNLRKTKTEGQAPARKLVPKDAAGKKVVAAAVKTNPTSLSVRPEILRRPHITEKAAAGAEQGVYVFKVATTANKRDIAKAISLFYKVTPVKVRIVTLPKKSITVKGRFGFRRGGKKAYVFLKKGEKIEVN